MIDQQILGNCSPESMATTRSPPTSERNVTMPGWLGHDLADDRGVSSQRMGSHDLHEPVGLAGRNDGDQLSFVGDIERVEPQHLARGPHLAADRDGGLGRA